MDKIQLSKLIAPQFFGVHRDARMEAHDEYWLKGGRGSTKSSFISLEVVQGILRHPGANAVCYRKVAENLRGSVYEQIVWAIHALQLAPWFRCKISPMEITYTPTGQRILFLGASDPERSKSLKLSKGYFKYLWFEELTEYEGMDSIRTIKQSVIRGGEHALTFYSYNPPQSAGSWVNVEALVPRPGRLVHHSDYLGVPAEWLGPSFLAEADALRQTNERVYRHNYLGEITGTGGQVFDNLQARPIEPGELQGLDRYYHGLDFGFAVDPDALVRCGYDRRARVLYVLGEYFGIRTPTETLAAKCKELCGSGAIACDSADPRMISELRNRGVQALAVKKGPGSIDHGIRWLQDLAAIVVDPARCPNVAREFSGYEYKLDRYGNFLSDYPDENNHTIDAVRYAVEELSTRRTVKTINRAAMGL